MELQSNKNRNLYRGPESSHAFNERMNDLYTDVVRLYDYLNENESKLGRNTDILLKEYQFGHSEINELMRRLEQVEAMNESLLAGKQEGKSIVLLDSPDSVLDAEESKRTYLDMENGVVSPNVSTVSSKVSIQTESGRVLISDKMRVTFKESFNTQPYDEASGERLYYDIDPKGYQDMVDKRKSSYWMRKVRFQEGSGVREVYGEAHIRLATESLTNLFANTLVVRPFPEGSMTIRDVHIKGPSGEWKRLPSFPMEAGEPKAIERAKRMMFSFGKEEVTELKVRYTQPYWVEDSGEREFVYGFQDIDLEYRGYTDAACEFVTRHVAGPGREFERVETPRVIYAEGAPKGVGEISHELYYDQALVTKFDFGTEILAPLSEVYVKTTIRKVGEDVPVVKRIELPYRFKSRD